QVHHTGDALLLHQVANRRTTNVHGMHRKWPVAAGTQVNTAHVLRLCQPLAQLSADITTGAGNQDIHAGLLDQSNASVRPDTRCQMPQQAAIKIMPLAAGKKVNSNVRPSPEFWMPTSMVTARRSSRG